MDTAQAAGDTPPFWCPETAFKREGRSRQSCVLGGPRGVIGAMAITVGYARVSTGSQRLDMQLDALTASGCTRVYTDTASIRPWPSSTRATPSSCGASTVSDAPSHTSWPPSTLSPGKAST